MSQLMSTFSFVSINEGVQPGLKKASLAEVFY